MTDRVLGVADAERRTCRVLERVSVLPYCSMRGIQLGEAEVVALLRLCVEESFIGPSFETEAWRQNVTILSFQ